MRKDNINTSQTILLILIVSLIIYILYFKDYVSEFFNKNNTRENFNIGGRGFMEARSSNRNNTPSPTSTTSGTSSASVTSSVSNGNGPATTQALECPSLEVEPDSSIIPATDPNGCLHVVLFMTENEHNVHVYIDSKNLPEDDSPTNIQGYVTIQRIGDPIPNSRRVNRIVLNSFSRNNNHQKFIVEYIDNSNNWCILKLASNPNKLLSYTPTNPTYQLGISSRFPPNSEPCLGYHKSQLWLLKRNELCENAPLEYLNNYNSPAGSNVNIESNIQSMMSAIQGIIDNRQGGSSEQENEASTRQCPEQNPVFNLNLSGNEQLSLRTLEGFQNPKPTLGDIDNEQELDGLIEDLTNPTQLSGTEPENIDCNELSNYVSTNLLASCNCQI